ncbi:PREDICTED: ceramide synthase 5-like isoform X2 [Polistes dominula]|uniref:Ceramide synthase 5-like isoform X2 n=1 Tax=Polistes dominula TaxID=743375 RepID=A0ABM1JDA1_POLDO|nr:PREDICTED: ceramide synthase 5-like isoform X2 [Polistes dominula]
MTSWISNSEYQCALPAKNAWWKLNSSLWCERSTKCEDINLHIKQYINSQHVLFLFLMSLFLFIMKYTFERYLFVLFGQFLGIKDERKKKVRQIEILKKAYINKKINHEQILALAKQLNCSERQIERWLRFNKFQDISSTLTKFCESCWRCFYYTCMFIYGLLILWNKPWFWNTTQCYYNYPYHSITNDIGWYYIITTAIYLISTITHFFETKRNDFWQVFIHHIIAIVLLFLTWVNNLTRLISLVIVLHDASEIFLELAKTARYANYKNTSNIMFVIFTISWICTRIGIFPFSIIYSLFFEAPKHMSMFPTFYVIEALLCLLFLLHLFWTYLIIKVAYNNFYTGQKKGDIRSDNEDVSDVSDNEINSSVNDTTKYNKHLI